MSIKNRAANPFLLLVGTLLCFFLYSNNLRAQECLFDSAGLSKVPDAGEELRKYMIVKAQYILCTANNISANKSRVSFPGQRELIENYAKFYRSELKLWTSRKSVPTLKQIREAFSSSKSADGQSDYGKAVTNFALHLNISEALFWEGQQIPSPYLDDMRAKGIDPPSRAAELARDTIFPDPPSWFTIGWASIDRTKKDLEEIKIKKAFEDAVAAHERAKADLAAEQKRMATVLDERQEFIRESAKQLSEIDRRIADLGARGDDIPKVLNTDRNDAIARHEADLKNYTNYADEFVRKIEQIEQRIENTRAEMIGPSDRYMRYLDGLGGTILKVETEQAVLEPTDIEGLRKIQNLLENTYDEISARSKNKKKLMDGRRAANKALEAAVADANSAADDLALKGALSVAYQYMIEVQASAVNLALAARGGPGGVLAEAVGQIATNVAGGSKYVVGGVALAGPSYYDATGLFRDVPKIARDAGTEDEAPLYTFEDGENSFKSVVARETMAVPYRTLVKMATAVQTAKASGQHRSLLQSLASEGLTPNNSLLRQMAAKDTATRVAAQELGQAIGKAGFRGIAKSILADAAENIAKELTKEGFKRAAAEVVEGGALVEYAASQMAVSEAYARMIVAGNEYWDNEAAIESLLGFANSLTERQHLGEMQATKNDAFFPLPGYRFVVSLVPGSIPNTKKFDADVFLHGVKLQRDQTSTEFAWKVPDGAVFGNGLPEALTLKVEIK